MIRSAIRIFNIFSLEFHLKDASFNLLPEQGQWMVKTLIASFLEANEQMKKGGQEFNYSMHKFSFTLPSFARE